jgi:hypothetical protein
MIAWPLIVFMTLVLVGRYRWCNRNLYERYFNNSLACLLVAQILREQLVQNILVRTSLVTLPGTWQLGSAVLGYSFTEFIGFSLLWSGMSEAETRRKHRYYRLAGVLATGALLICGSRARREEVPFELMDGWDSVAVSGCMVAMVMVLATLVIWNSLRELRTGGTRRERWIALSTLSMGLIGAGIVLHEAALHILDQLDWTDTTDYRQGSNASGLFFAILLPFVFAVVPLAMKLVASFGLDSITRSWCKLQPLRHAMRTIVPECVFNLDADEPGRRKSELQLHYAVVEIRDAILQLRPYFSDIPDHDWTGFLDEPDAVPARDHDAAVAAFHLAHAARAKAAGSRPQPHHVDSALIIASRAATLEEEAAELVVLARWWPAAYAATEHLVESAANTKASPTI